MTKQQRSAFFRSAAPIVIIGAIISALAFGLIVDDAHRRAAATQTSPCQ